MAVLFLASLDSFIFKRNAFILNLVLNTKMKSLADTKEWKKLRKDIEEANKDPEFRKGIKRFIKIASR